VPSVRARRLRGADARCALQVLRVHPDRPSQHADAARFERVQAAWEALRVRLVVQRAATREQRPDAATPQDSGARARYDMLTKPHAVRHRVVRPAAPQASPHSLRHAGYAVPRRRPGRHASLLGQRRCAVSVHKLHRAAA
jgi:hypothetical protein